MLLTNRKKAVEKYNRPFVEKGMMKGFKMIASKRIGFDFFHSAIKNAALYMFNFGGWGPKRSTPTFAQKSFSQQFKKTTK